MTTTTSDSDDTHAEKFKVFLEMIEAARSDDIDHVIVGCPHDLGDTYEEVMENLSLLRAAGIYIHIAGDTCPLCLERAAKQDTSRRRRRHRT